MKSFEKEIAKRIRTQKIKAVVVTLFVMIIYIIKIYGGIEFVSHVDNIILVGFFCGGFFTSIRTIQTYSAVLKSPEALADLHIRETDERNRMITLKSCQSTVKLTYTLLGIAAIIVSFFSKTVFYTISATFVIVIGIYVWCVRYYSRKF